MDGRYTKVNRKTNETDIQLNLILTVRENAR